MGEANKEGGGKGLLMRGVLYMNVEQEERMHQRNRNFLLTIGEIIKPLKPLQGDKQSSGMQ